MEEFEYYEKIDDYLNDRLDEAERMAFEQALLQNAELQENLIIYRNLKKATSEPEVNDLRQKMSRWAESVDLDRSEISSPEMHPSKKEELRVISVKINNKRWWLAAASVAVLLCAVYLFNKFGSGASSEELFADNFSTPRAITISGYRGDADTAAVIEILQKIEVGYQKKDYQNVIALFEEMLKIAPKASSYANEAHRGKAIAYLAIGKGLEAETELNQISEGFEEDRAWYGALALLLQNGKSPEARTAFKRFSTNQNFQSDRRKSAAKIVRDLR